MTAAILILTSFLSFAQRDGFFNDWKEFRNVEEDDLIMPQTPTHGYGEDASAPLNDGLIILLVTSIGYAVKKTRSAKNITCKKFLH